jgi:hypothetical protein
MTSEVESKLVSRRRILPFLGVAAAAGLALRYTAAEAQTSGSEAQTSGSKALTPGAARRQERRGGRVERRYERRGGTPASKQPAQGQPAQGQATQAQPGGQKQ